MVDEGGNRGTITELKMRLKNIYNGKASNDGIDKSFQDVVKKYNIPIALPMALIEGFDWDMSNRRYNSITDLTEYAIRVAGSVGAMISVLMGVCEKRELVCATTRRFYTPAWPPLPLSPPSRSLARCVPVRVPAGFRRRRRRSHTRRACRRARRRRSLSRRPAWLRESARRGLSPRRASLDPPTAFASSTRAALDLRDPATGTAALRTDAR